MNTSVDLASAVEALKTQFSNTRELYQEVCSVLFFDFGMTPTQNKLYQLVKRGSMSVPAEELQKFWDRLRDQRKLPSFDHPTLPEGLKAATVNAMSALWDEAQQLAKSEIAAARLELQAEVDRALAATAAAEQAVQQASLATEGIRAELAREVERRRSVQAELETERRERAAAHGRIDEMTSRLDQARTLQQETQEAFSADGADSILTHPADSILTRG